jgi:hypothetical protein
VRQPYGRDLLDRMIGESQTDAYAMTSTIHALADASAAGVIDEARAWELILQLADRAQQVFGSWRDFGASYSTCIEQASDGRASGDAEVAAALSDPAHPWNVLPWDTPLIPQRQAWALAIAAPLVVDAGGDPRYVAGARYRADAADALAERARAWLDAHEIATTDAVIAYVNARFAAPGDRAFELARAIAVLEYGVHARLVPEEDAWFVALSAAALVQRAFASWQAFGDAFERGWQAAGHAVEPMSSQVAALRRGLWSTLPWGTDLQVDITGDGRSAPTVARIAASVGRPRD